MVTIRFLFLFANLEVVHDHLKSDISLLLIFGLDGVDNFAQQVDFLLAALLLNRIHQNI